MVVSAHSTGGLTVPLWLHDRRLRPAGVFLNAPWIDCTGTRLTRLLALPVIDRIGRVQPMREIPRERSGGYLRSISDQHSGEWTINADWKPLRPRGPAYAGWLRAVRRGTHGSARGLDVQSPVLMITSTTTGTRGHDDPDLRTTDVVLDVERMRRKATRIVAPRHDRAGRGGHPRRHALPRAGPLGGLRRDRPVALGVRREVTR